MLTQRGRRYLATLERVPAWLDRGRIEYAIQAADAPIFEPIIQFQIQFGGYVQWQHANRFEWGILHRRPDQYSYFQPDQIEYLFEREQHTFTCCNCHASDQWYLDQDGTLHWCMLPISTSFAIKIEQDALIWELNLQYRKQRRIEFAQPASEVIPLLHERLQPGKVLEASDRYNSVYFYQGVYAMIGQQRIHSSLLGIETSELLQGIAVKR